MKNWNVPSVEELEVKLTASSGSAAETETGASWPWDENTATYDSSIYEKVTDEATCTSKIVNCAGGES